MSPLSRPPSSYYLHKPLIFSRIRPAASETETGNPRDAPHPDAERRRTQVHRGHKPRLLPGAALDEPGERPPLPQAVDGCLRLAVRHVQALRHRDIQAPQGGHVLLLLQAQDDDGDGR